MNSKFWYANVGLFPAIMVFLVSMGVTLFSWQQVKKREILYQEARFQLTAKDIVDNIEKRLIQHEQILLGSAGLFDASPTVDRSAWKAYVDRLQLAKNYPGILGVGFSLLLKPDELARHEQAIRAEGFPQYHVKPVGKRDLYTSIIFLEPFEGRNLAAFGFDMASERTRALAMWQAAENGITIISGKVTLVQENKGKVQAGFLMYVPVYRKQSKPQNVAERRAALYGFAYSPYRVDDLMEGILGRGATGVEFQIFDGTELSPENRLYDTTIAAGTTVGQQHLRFRTVRQLHVFGRQWTVVLSERYGAPQDADVEAVNNLLLTEKQLPQVVLTLGTSISFLILFLMYFISRQRDAAVRMAEEMTSEIRESHETLRRSEERFDFAVRGTNDGIWDWNIVENSFYYSPRVFELLGLSENDLPQGLDSLQALAHPDDKAILQQQLSNHLQNHATFDARFRLQVQGKDGTEWRWFNARGMAIRSEQGVAVRMAGALTDITERYKAEQMKSEFVSIVSHELRTPLTSISGSLRLACGGVLGDLPPKAKNLLETAYKNSLRLGALIDDLLDMEKLSAGKMQMHFEVTEVLSAVELAVETNRSYAEQWGVGFDIQAQLEHAFVRTDPARFQQILANFLSNAAKYSPKSCNVDVTVARIGSMIRISVRDYGPGIPKEFRERLFQKFSQADSSDTREKGGTGLGLAITKDLVEGMGGKLGFESEVGKGSCFYVELPEITVTAQNQPTLTEQS